MLMAQQGGQPAGMGGMGRAPARPEIVMPEQDSPDYGPGPAGNGQALMDGAPTTDYFSPSAQR